ncbi:hypothetical protein FOA43_001188 [Brettanomyces nanus]|uniref:Uncharacterized protein n=1 Tax=Eeniella nana TaxID=13502 RepID=A0A875RYZ8_EENNA|nr:uncharacterized protein FOA43_001188 [Brettanomyces nanus]QPG73873.1 hypothetical protein FOA43_001188 [Brettanomyces nanus]
MSASNPVSPISSTYSISPVILHSRSPFLTTLKVSEFELSVPSTDRSSQNIIQFSAEPSNTPLEDELSLTSSSGQLAQSKMVSSLSSLSSMRSRSFILLDALAAEITDVTNSEDARPVKKPLESQRPLLISSASFSRAQSFESSGKPIRALHSSSNTKIASSSTDISSSSVVNSSHASRKRSKTLGSYENFPGAPPPSYGASTGLLGSITTFIKSKSRSSLSRSTSIESSSLESLTTLLPVDEDSTPSDYLDILLRHNPVTSIVALLSSKDDEFFRLTLRDYFARYFDFTQYSIDMALRQFLMLNELPKEAQQIDRVVYEFGRFYSQQHSETGLDTDTCYILTYALLMLHTDKFNPNNKQKMTRWEFIDNLLMSLMENRKCIDKDKGRDSPSLVTKEVLGYLYDNVVHSQFVRINRSQCKQALVALQTDSAFFPYPSCCTLVVNPGSSTSVCPLSQTSLSLVGRRKSSFLWQQPIIDVYEYITERKVKDLRLDIDFHFTNPFIGDCLQASDARSVCPVAPSMKYADQQIGSSFGNPDTKLLEKIINCLTDLSCRVVFKVPKQKAGFMCLPLTERISYNEKAPIETSKEYYIVRVVKLGLVARQESRLRSNAKSWKQYFCILTPVGMFFFKSLNLFKMVYHPGDESTKTLVLEQCPSSSTTTNLLESFDPSLVIRQSTAAMRSEKSIQLDEAINIPALSKRTLHGQLHHYTFYIYTRNSKETCMVDNEFELKFWINSINALSALAPVKLAAKNLKIFLGPERHKDEFYTEIRTAGTQTLTTRMTNLKTSIEKSKSLLLEYLQTVKKLELLTPLEPKSRDELLSSAKILNIKLEWMWYEATRGCELHKILDSVSQLMI